MAYSEVLDKYRDVVVANAEQKVHRLTLQLNKLPRNEQRRFFGGSATAGFLYLYRDDKVEPGHVVEIVCSAGEKDAITSLYVNHRIFSSIGELLHARGELIRDVARKIGLPPESIGIDDPVRGRALGLEELSTGQLIDVLAERLGHTVLRTDSHAADAPEEMLA